MESSGDGSFVSIVLLLLIGWVTVWMILAKIQCPRNLPPGPPSLPIVGSIPFISLSRENHLTLSDLGKKYGSIAHVWFGNKLVVVGSYEMIREALLDNPIAMAGRPAEFVNPNRSPGIALQTHCNQWKHDHKLVVTILKDLGHSIMQDRIQEEVETLIDHLDSMSGVAFDPSHVIEISSCNFFCSLLLGKRFSYDDHQIINMVEDRRGSSEDAVHIIMVKLAPILQLLPGKRAALKRQATYEKRNIRLLMEHVEYHKVSHVAGDRSDFIHAYMEETGAEVNDESLAAMLDDLFGGSTGIPSVMRWAFVYMANYPGIQKKVQEELDKVLEKGRRICSRDKTVFPYTETVIQEILRLAVVSPQITPHETLDDVTVAGYSIPKGAWILGNLWGILRDPILWPEPDKMKPERFLTDCGKVLYRTEMIPFSLGRRGCPAQMVTKRVLFHFFTAILHNYSIERPDGVDKIDETGKTLRGRLPNDYQIVLSRRTPLCLECPMVP